MVRKRTEAKYEFQISDFRFESGGGDPSARFARLRMTVLKSVVAGFSASLIGGTRLIGET
jgi:hypothetical protein